jgi:hypothetical protein
VFAERKKSVPGYDYPFFLKYMHVWRDIPFDRTPSTPRNSGLGGSCHPHLQRSTNCVFLHADRGVCMSLFASQTPPARSAIENGNSSLAPFFRGRRSAVLLFHAWKSRRFRL